jgi:urease subunit gamma/beta
MHLTPREQERLLLSSGADLARRRLARGARLGAAEAMALVCDEICEMAWDDVPLEEVVERARSVVPAESLLPGVAAAVPSVQVEALFPHGTVLVHVAAPFGAPESDGAGAVRTQPATVELAPGRRHEVATLHNTGAQPIWVSSHFPLGALNPALEVSLADAAGYRLDVPAGVAVRIDPGERKEVGVVGIEVTAR